MSQRPTMSPTTMIANDATGCCRLTRGTYLDCPLCGSDLLAEHAHYRCAGCGWRDSCCD